MKPNRPLVLLMVASFAFSASSAQGSDMLKAKRLYERLTGVKVPSNRPALKQVADLLADGKNKEAAELVMAQPDFTNVQARNFALRLSNKDESVKVALNDFSALVTGVIRDNKDFRQILTGEFSYTVRGTAKEDDLRTFFFNSEHYTRAEAAMLDLHTRLQIVPRQQLAKSFIGTGKTTAQLRNIVDVADHPEPSGALTTRAFAEANLSGGTNRRAVEFSLKQFLCTPMAEAADANASDQFVGKDVERFPAGNHNKYLTSCKSCHSVMDGMRPAFGKMEYIGYNNGQANLGFSPMHGDFYINHSLGPARTAYFANVFNPTKSRIIPDLETNQMNSDYAKKRIQYLLDIGQTTAAATKEVADIVNLIRDPATLSQVTEAYRSANAAKINQIRSTRTSAETIALYGSALNAFKNTSLSTADQERKFLKDNQDLAEASALLYVFYDELMISQKYTDAQRTQELRKFAQIGRPRDEPLTIRFLQESDQSYAMPGNSFSARGIATKLNKGSYAYGFNVDDDTFVNNAVLGNKSSYFGWRGNYRSGGRGIQQFGHMLADSRRFSQCMSQKVYESVCRRSTGAEDTALISRLANQFENSGYRMRDLYRAAALDPSCRIMEAQ